MKKIALTYGDINGIGVEILIKALNFLGLDENEVLIVGSQKVFDYYSNNYNLSLNKKYEIIDVTLDDGAFSIGEENAKSGEHCFQVLKKTCELAKFGYIKNIVTAPVSKHVLNMAGHNFSGQTEVLEHFLAKDNEKSEMLFVANDFKILLLTRHIQLKDVPSVLNEQMVIDKIERLNNILKTQFKLSNPNIGILALNPHAGENGLLGIEEKTIINPAIKKLKKKGINVNGALVSDAAFAQFGKAYFNNEKLPYDCYVAMYHDQGLIPMKLLAMDNAINTTIGLSAIRTSPSHGTAFDIAGKNIARAQSMISATKLALELC